MTTPGVRSVKGVDLRSLASGDCGFESPPLAWIFFSCEFRVFSRRDLCDGRSLNQRIPTEYVEFECDLAKFKDNEAETY